MGVDMVCTVLGIVFYDENQGAVLVRAHRDLFHEEADGVIVGGQLCIWRIDAVYGDREVAEVFTVDTERCASQNAGPLRSGSLMDPYHLARVFRVQ